jgi:endonuclease-3
MTPPRGAKARAPEVLARFRREHPARFAYLHHGSPFQLLVAVILSAQARDATVNRRTPGLFARYPNAETMARAEPEDLEGLLAPITFARSKAKHLVGMARMLVERHGGQVPSAMADLVELPGVARKTASVVQGYVSGRAEGVAVDTHVRRVSYRLALTDEEDPKRIEKDLMALYPPEDWPDINFHFIWHGRHGPCVARRPRCPECIVQDLCPKVGVTEMGAPKGGAAPRKAGKR